MIENIDSILEKNKNLFEIQNIIKIFKKNIDEFIKEDHTDPRKRALAQTVNGYIEKATNGNLKERGMFKDYLKTKFLTSLDIYTLDDDGRLSEIPLIKNMEISEQYEYILNYIIPFDDIEQLTTKDKFQILMRKYREINEQGYDKAFYNFKIKYPYQKERLSLNGFKNKWNEYSQEEIDVIFRNENIKLSFVEKVDVIIQRIYEELYGLKEIDILAYSDVNEVGISNSGEYIYVWSEEKIHLSFLKVSEDTMRIIQEKAISFDETNGALTTSNPDVLCFRADKARVTALQSNYSAAREICIRIFNMNTSNFEDIIQNQKQQILLQTLLKTGLKFSLQGSLGAGKTTSMQTFLETLDDSLHIGIVEDVFEQHNRLKYPNKRIVEIQALPKGNNIKTLLDATMTLFRLSVDVASVGEARDGEALFSFIQLAQALSNSTLFTTHVASPEDSVPRFKNMLISTGKYFSEQAAVSDIINYINIICQHEIIDNKRCISQIVEIVPLTQKSSEIDIDMNTDIETLRKMADIQQIQQNTSYMYKLNPLMVYENGKYRFVNYPSKKTINRARSNKETWAYMKDLLKLMEEDIGTECFYKGED